MHEIGHVLGMYHTQKRDNHENVVKINKEFIIPTKRHNFDKILKGSAKYYNLPYDITSLLHYKPLVCKIKINLIVLGYMDWLYWLTINVAV